MYEQVVDALERAIRAERQHPAPLGDQQPALPRAVLATAAVLTAAHTKARPNPPAPPSSRTAHTASAAAAFHTAGGPPAPSPSSHRRFALLGLWHLSANRSIESLESVSGSAPQALSEKGLAVVDGVLSSVQVRELRAELARLHHAGLFTETLQAVRQPAGRRDVVSIVDT